MSDLLRGVEQFLFHEAHLLDERRFEQWLALFDRDGWYWMPVSPADVERKRTPALIDDNRPELELRIRRLLEPAAHTEHPAPTACRSVSNVVLEDPGAVIVRSKLVMHEYRACGLDRDEVRLFCATVRHRLQADGDSFRILWKRVDLFNAAAALTLMPTPV